MQVKMTTTMKGRDAKQNPPSVKNYEAGKVYEILDAHLVEVFVDNGWADLLDVEDAPVEAAPVKEDEAPAKAKGKGKKKNDEIFN